MVRGIGNTILIGINMIILTINHNMIVLVYISLLNICM